MPLRPLANELDGHNDDSSIKRIRLKKFGITFNIRVTCN